MMSQTMSLNTASPMTIAKSGEMTQLATTPSKTFH